MTAHLSALPSWTRWLHRAYGNSLRHALKATPAATAKTAFLPSKGRWTAGLAMGAMGMRHYRVYWPENVQVGERLPLMVMLHGCGQDAQGFAASTGMNRLAARERFVVLYPEQDRLANPQGCWNWFDTDHGRAQGEAALILNAIDQICLTGSVDRHRVAVAGLSAGASMAALLATRYPGRFKAVVMHSGVPPGMAHSAASALGAMQGHRTMTPLRAAAPPFRAAQPALLAIHGTLDRVVSADNAHAATHAWAAAGGAHAGAGRRLQRGQRHACTVTDFKQRDSTVATLVEVDGLGHAWSGGAASQPFSDALGPDASRMAWAFALKQFAH